MATIARRTALAGCISVAALAGVGPGHAMYVDTRSYEDAFTVMASDARFSTWVGIIVQAGLVPNARGSVPFTMFAPTNAAFARYPTLIQQLLPNASQAFPDTSQLIRLVRSHILYGLHPVSEFEGKNLSFTSAAGTPLTVNGTDQNAIVVTWASVNGQTGTAHLMDHAVQAANALIYPIDDVMLNS